MLFSRIVMDIAPDTLVIIEAKSYIFLLAAAAIGLLTFAVIFTVVRRKRAKAREQQKQTQDQVKQDPGQ